MAGILSAAIMLGSVSLTAMAEDTPVAQIGDNEYSTFEAAINEAANGDTIDLLGNTINLKSELPSKTIEISSMTLTFTNGTFDLTDFGTPTDSVNATFFVTDGSDVTFNNVAFTGTNYCSAFGIIYANNTNEAEVPEVTITDCTFTLNGDHRVDGGILKGYTPETSKFTIKNSSFTGTNIVSAIKNTTVDIDNCTFDLACTLNDAGNFQNHAFRGLKGSIKNSSIKADGFETGFKDNAVTVENTDLSLTNSYNNGDVVSCENKLQLISGNFSFDPTPYLEKGKTAVASEKNGYLFTIGDKKENITVATETKVATPEVKTTEDITLSTDATTAAANANNNSNTNNILSYATIDIKNDETLMNSSKVTDAVDAVKGDDDTAEVTVVVVPKIEMNVTNASDNDGVKTIELDIKATYDIVATTNADDMKFDGDDKNAETIVSGQKLEITKPLDITIPLPDGFAAGNSEIYVKHTKDNGKTYIYKAIVSEDGKTATFTNPNGFSKFEATTKTPVAIVDGVYYETLQAAVNEAANQSTIKLMSDTNEKVTVTRTVSFLLDVDTYSFTGSIEAGQNTTLTVDGNNYSFVYTRPSTGGGSTLASYTVKFDTNGGSKISNKSVNRNKTVAEPAEPTKDGYTFGGWFTDKDLTAKYDFSTPVTKSITLYAAWNEVEATEPTPDNDTAEPTSNTITLTIGKTEANVFGKDVTNDVAPLIVNDRTMLPARFVAESLGATVEWDGENEVVTITGKNVATDEDVTIVITIGADTAVVNGTEVELDSPAFIENERTYTPLRFIAENLGADVEWNEESQAVTITVE